MSKAACRLDREGRGKPLKTRGTKRKLKSKNRGRTAVMSQDKKQPKRKQPQKR